MRFFTVCILVSFVVALAGNDDKRPAETGSKINTKARVEAGEGVPYFDERFSCREDGGAWSAYRELVEYARLRIFEKGEGEQLAEELALSLAERTSDVSKVLQCNVGVIAGYHLLARRYVASGDDWKAYRLLQLALIYVFTLRNALQVPEDAGRDWATRTDSIVQEIKILKARLSKGQQRRLARLPEVSTSLRIPGLRIAVVSICAYPKDHPLVLRVLTPENRRLYAERHGYSFHVHMEHPMPDEGIHIQHSKLQLVADYLRSGNYDWVAWLDCDSILMNLNHTLDSIVYRYARQIARTQTPLPSTPKPPTAATNAKADTGDKAPDSKDAQSCEGCNEEITGPILPVMLEVEPLEDEVLEAIVGHVGSCNSEQGCHASAQLRVNPRTRYTVSIRTALIDMEDNGEKLKSLSVGGVDLGECNPHPESDYDCRMHSCFKDVEVPPEAAATGVVLLKVHSVKTNNDCRCNRIHGICYNNNLAMFEEVTEGSKITDPSYGAFVKFVLTPQKKVSNSSMPVAQEKEVEVTPERTSLTPQQDQDEELDGCSCSATKDGMSSKPGAFPWWFWDPPQQRDVPPTAVLRRRGAECDGPDVLLGVSVSLPLCLQLCRQVEGCEFVSYGIGKKRGQCHWEVNDCLVFEEDSYAVWDIRPTLSSSTSSEVTSQGRPLQLGCSSWCAGEASIAADEAKDRAAAELSPPGEDEGVDLLITEEGWGLSSANWIIRRSDWSISFLEKAFELCHRDMPLFGDQDAMIHLLFNEKALSFDSSGDALDSHAVIIPQRELNAYDALNAHFMGCDGFEDGDLLVTFPGCKDAGACNPLFKLANGYALGSVSANQDETGHRSAHHIRLFGPGQLAADLLQASRL
eukprot:TRINITY_DN63239_c0_g1_i1.p1 TRINITY_DN63239_c0_g1~~TRINITY_DN63239_c0_g1_i1.p1  ORF type:complete len:862 (-),score=141.54 TRINITY_DN63239_c0_g1_i1:117-2702(-)